MTSIRDRFEAKTCPEPNTGCLLWTGATGSAFSGGAYGSMKITTRMNRGAHRVAWELERGPIPDGLSVLHRCDQPLCVNVDHLFLGSHAANMADMATKGRSMRGTGHFRSKLTPATVLAIRASSEPSRTLAKAFGVAYATIEKVRYGKTWTHVQEAS